MAKHPLKISGMHNGAKPEIYRNARKLREDMTEAELKLWEYLRTKPSGYKFRRQHPLGNYILDFYCHKLRISIEVDGGYHLTKEHQARDKERTAYVASLGVIEYRSTNEEILNDFDKSTELINEILRSGSPFDQRKPVLGGAGGERGTNLDRS